MTDGEAREVVTPTTTVALIYTWMGTLYDKCGVTHHQRIAERYGIYPCIEDVTFKLGNRPLPLEWIRRSDAKLTAGIVRDTCYCAELRTREHICMHE